MMTLFQRLVAQDAVVIATVKLTPIARRTLIAARAAVVAAAAMAAVMTANAAAEAMWAPSVMKRPQVNPVKPCAVSKARAKRCDAETDVIAPMDRQI